LYINCHMAEYMYGKKKVLNYVYMGY
jgi:hypothetical protein